MTVSSEVSDVTHDCDGTTITFVVPFYFLVDSDLAVTVVNADGSTSPLVLSTNYTVAGAGVQTGGSITTTGTPLAAGKKVRIERDPPATQETAYQANDPFPAEEHEKALDKLTMLIQRAFLYNSRSLRYPITESFDGTLPLAGNRKGMLLGFDPVNGAAVMLPLPASIGAGDLVPFTKVAGTDFNPGDSTITLPRSPGTPANLHIFFDGVPQDFSQWDVSSVTVTFTSPIPAGVTKIWGYIGTTLSIMTPPADSIGPDQIIDRAVGDLQLAWGTGLGRMVDNMTQLKALDTTVYKRAFGVGYAGPGDGGGGPYWFDAASSEAEIQGVIVAPTVGTGRWKLIHNGSLSAAQCGARDDAVANAANVTAIRAAVSALKNGDELTFPRVFGQQYLVNDEILLPKPILIRGTGTGSQTGGITVGTSDTDYPCIKQTVAGKSIFKMQARKENYAFDQFGILGMCFKDIALEGKAIADRSVSGITTDTTINGGDYHIRHCDFDNVQTRFFQRGIDLTGINYLNVFTRCKFYWCDTGFLSAKGAASDSGGQTRFFGCTFDQCGDCASLNEDTSAGSFGFSGCTLSESRFGIRTTGACMLSVSDSCEFESLTTGSGTGAGIYIKVTTVPSDATRYIVGNKFLSSENDIWIDKTSTSSTDGNFSFPTLIDGNTFLSTKAITVSVPVGHLPMAGRNFVIGPSNSGLNGGFLADSQITGFAGLDQRKHTFKRRYTFNNAALAPGFLVVPAGVVMVKARVYFTANASSSTGFSIGDQSNGGRYLNALNAQTATLNQWYGWQDSPPQPVTDANMTNLQTSFTAGANGAAGVVEIEYYVP